MKVSELKMVKISVIMGAYNSESTIEESLDSLLNQTYSNFEIIICDDGSTDNTYRILKKISSQNPEKIIVLKNTENEGLNYTLNKCAKYVKGEYIARMDADDISHSKRFEIENEFLDNELEYAFVSTAMIYFDENGDWGRSKLKENPRIQDFPKGTPFAHAPVMMRREAFEVVEGYSEGKYLNRVEDYHLWVKMYANGFKGYNISTPLYKMRDDRNAYNRRSFTNRINEAYVKWIAIKMLDLSLYNIIYLLRPLIVGILPERLYTLLHKKRLNN